MTGRRGQRRWLKQAARLGSAALLGGCAVLTPLPTVTSLAERLKALPVTGLPLTAAVSIAWNDQGIPWIEAASDADAAFALGLVHAHLRLGQMEILRHIARGRLAEIGGPIAVDIDHALRILNYGKVAPAVVAAMPPPERTWLDQFVAGINHYQRTVRELPHEYTVLGLDREPWTAEDVVTLGRLASTDINWLVWFRLLAARNQPDWTALWSRLVGIGSSSVPSFATAAAGDLAPIETILAATGRFGSNSLAVSGGRSRSGGALIASDPHLGLSLPNLWLIAGIKSPSYHMVGLMVPGLPFVAVGRNQRIAWGGTNMRAASSDLFDVSALPPDRITSRSETIRVRWWFDTEVTVRETALGPVISDAPMLTVRPGEMLALKWIGHRPSDELTAMLKVNRAQNWDQFRTALEGFSISPQNFLFADVDGHIGQVTATHLPARPAGLPADLVLPPQAASTWDRILTSRDLPVAFDPPAGFLASANNRAADAPVPLGYFFASNDRILRLKELLGGNDPLNLIDLGAIQRDVFQRSALVLRDAVVARWRAASATPPLGPPAARILSLIEGWDGFYRVDSKGAPAFEAVAAHLVELIYQPKQWQAIGIVGRPFTIMAEDLAALPDRRLIPALAEALAAAASTVDRTPTWGAMHRMAVHHLFGMVPVIGGRYRFGDLPVGGSSETLLRTATALSADRQVSRFGATARHLSDLADPDANWFILMGGQDGWLNSANFTDQVALWQTGQYIQVPMTPGAVHRGFTFRTVLVPR